MATPLQCVFDLSPPRRPGIDDVGGGRKEDDQEFPPDPISMPTGLDDNQHQNLLVRYGSVSPLAIVTVHFATGAPFVHKVTCVRAAVNSATFTVTDEATGVTLLSWPAGTFPAAVADHDARATGATPGTATVETVTNGARVRLTNLANPPALADLPFNLYLY